jgi:cytochrome b561
MEIAGRLHMQTSRAIVLRDGRVLRGRFDALTILFHWSTVTLVLFQLASGWAASELGALSVFPHLLDYHRSTGTVLWFITLARLVWRQTNATFPPFPSHIGRIARAAAQVNEYGLYAMAFFQPVSGISQMVLRGRPFTLLGLTVPQLMPRNLFFWQEVHALHAQGAVVFAALIGVHAAAALVHHYYFRDDVLETMAPILRHRSRQPDLRDQAIQVSARMS